MELLKGDIHGIILIFIVCAIIIFFIQSFFSFVPILVRIGIFLFIFIIFLRRVGIFLIDAF